MSALLLLAVAVAPTPMHYSCTAALVLPNGQFTNSTPIAVSFVSDGKTVRDVHVIDAGGILFPGGNMVVTRTPEATSIGGSSMPAERPGTWSGRVEKKMYRLRFTGGNAAETADLAIGRNPVGATGRLGVIWHASHQPDGMPRPLTGQGVGQCALSQMETAP